ncbi:MAG: PVC-type heme-binding CxxCH protein [Flavitalea sp.]
MSGKCYFLCFASMLWLGCGVQESNRSELSVPEGFEIEAVVSPDSIAYPMFASFDGEGRLFVFESTRPNTMGTDSMLQHPVYDIRLLEDRDGDGIFEKSGIFADKLPLPMGGTFYQGSLYIAAPPNLERLTDTDGDGVADKREVLLTGWTLHANGATLSGPFFGPDGWMYMADARRGFEITSKEGKVLKGKGSRIWRCRPDGTGLEWVAGGGFDNSIELAFMPSGETIGTMTYFIDPQDGQRDAIMHWVEGGVYPKPQEVIREDKLKLTGELMPVMTKLPRVAPAGIMRYRGTAFGPEFGGNLFVAEFNTGRVMRYTVKEAGATYSTEGVPFLTSLNTDIHPTDVLQDADGSLLVVVTGGWFIEGCPLSRVAKPDVKGGIYRIRRKAMAVVDDPRGKDLGMDKLSAGELVKYMSDPRMAVSDKAIEALTLKGASSIAPLREMLKAEKEELRASAVFALYRINLPEAITAARSALNDRSPLVRTAAARVAGLARDTASVEKLMSIVQKDKAQVRRQAATALGQIGDARAIAALLNAAADTDDRFVEHAIIASLTSLNHPQPLVEALVHPASNVRRAAAIALDQMDGSPLTKKNLTPFLAASDSKLLNTGIWIASHHLEWGEVIVDFLEKRMDSLQLSEAERKSVGDLLITFSANTQLQDFIGRQLTSGSTTVSKKLFLFDIIERSPLHALPQVWISPLKGLLAGSNGELRLAALRLIESRSIPALDKQLEQITANEKTPADFRLKAFGARLMSSPKLSSSEFFTILNYLNADFEPPVRQQAARLLVKADLDNLQLLEIAGKYIPKADLILLPSLVDAFQGSKDEKAGMALVAALEQSNDRLDNLSGEDLQQLLNAFPSSVQQAAAPVMNLLGERHAARLSKLKEYEAKLTRGDVGEGRKIFFGKGTCFICHSVGRDGGAFAPDLTNIGEIRSRHDILEAILFPSASFAREYETSRITTKTNTYTGIIAQQLPDAITLKTGPGATVRILRSEMTGITPHTVSMMPPGLDQQLSAKEMSDLVTFLEALPYKIERLIEAREKK